ncbi:colicin-like pore-forming protein [Dryocola clanedunensis]
MSKPVRISNPGAESLGFLPNGEEVMAIYIDARPPTIEIFNHRAPAWSSFGNKTSWGSSDWVDDSPTRQDKIERDQEITTIKTDIDAQLKNILLRSETTKQHLARAITNKANAEKMFREAHINRVAKNELLGHQIKVALADLNEYALKTELAGYVAFNIHGEAQKIFADADSLRINSRESKELINKAKNKEKEAKNADAIASSMSAEYENRKAGFDKLLSNIETEGDSNLALLTTQHYRLTEKLARNEEAIHKANMKLSNTVNDLLQSKNQLRNAEKNLSNLQSTIEGRTIVSPEKNPIKISSKHKVFVKDPMFSGRIDIVTEAEINKRFNLDYLLSHSALDYKINILNDRDAVKSDDYEGDRAIYKLEVAEWEKLRTRLLTARNQINTAQNVVNAAKGKVQQKSSENDIAHHEINRINEEIIQTRKNLKEIDDKISLEKLKNEDIIQIKDAMKISSDFFKEIYSNYGDLQSKIAQELAASAKGKKIRNFHDAIKSFEKFKSNLNKKYSISDRKAISNALESVKRSELSRNVTMFSKSFGLTSTAIDFYDITMEMKTAIETDNWRPFFVKIESQLANIAAGRLTAWVFSLLLGTPLGILGFAVIMAAVSALVNDKLLQKINSTIGLN